MFLKLLTIIFFVNLLSQLIKSSSQFLDNFTYNGFHPPLSLISLQGIASVTPSGLLKLTNTTSHQTGHAFYNKPIRFKDSSNNTVSSFSTTFVFAIRSQFTTLSGDGIAFVVAPNPSLPFAKYGQYLGLFNPLNNGNETNNIFAVELDTIQNNEFNDTNYNHVGIDINSLKSVKSSRAGYWDERGQFKDLTLISGKPMQVWVDYNGRTHQINVTMAPFRNDKPAKPLVSTVRDLSPVLLQDMFVGFSSSTGLIKSEHVILGWSFQVNGKAPPLALQRLPKLLESQLRRSGISPFIPVSVPLVFILSIIFLVCFILRRSRRKFSKKLEDWETEFMKNRLNFKDLYYATRGFDEKNLLGVGGVLLVDWVFGFWNEGNILDAKDPKLGTEYDQREVEMVLKLGLLCSHFNPQARPTMRQVLYYLSGDAMLPELLPLDLRGSEMMLGTHHRPSEIGMFTCESSMVDSVLSSGR
ncbi:unnamed protein product [Eruca vesicaria subsp. sativa]|uniref:non-specific serine/threonine protein kinase n=1 Tax=Eruca vesicaria subsp. sativa TaxID=29727 RepID=A0ABC8K512_ERUVS|nr:unnamed protein product [Eruca vesicaria subsp. sativa]